MREVAARAGVSVATVSRALSGSTLVAIEVRQRVQDVADELGYVASRLPANLRAKNVRILALVVGNVRNAYFPELIDGCGEAAHAAGYPLIFGDSNEDPGRESEILEQLALERVAGVALATSAGMTEGLRRLLNLGIPVVAVDRRVAGVEIDTVTVGSHEGALAGVRHLVGLGHRRIGVISGPASLSTLAERLEGYRAGLEEAGIALDASLVMPGDLTLDTARGLARSLLRRQDRPTAVLCFNDLSTLGALHGIRDAGLRVPRDVSLLGFDELPGADLIDPPLTVIAQPVFDIGRSAIELLARRVSDPDVPVEELVLPTRLVMRASTAAPKVSDGEEVPRP